MAESKKALILDVRTQKDFIESHIPGSIFIGLNGSFAPWVGTLISNIKQPLILVVPEGKSEEAITRLARVGYDNTLGYLNGGINTWVKSGRKYDQLTSISPFELEKLSKQKTLSVLDVRKEGEYDTMHLMLDGLQNFPLNQINKFTQLDAQKTYYIHCAGGYRSVIAASILKSNGFHNIIDIAGGFAAIKKTNLNLTESTCPSNL
jgi:rhodanese-related sulfurtransferase